MVLLPPSKGPSVSRLKRFAALIAATVVGLTGAVVVAPAATAAISSSGVFSVPYSGDLYNVNAGTGQIKKLSLAEWQGLGSPAPRPAPTDFVKYSWSPTIYAVTFFGSSENEWVWETIDGAEWARAGFPSPRNAGWVAGTYLYKWSTSPEIFAIAPDGRYRKLDYMEWVNGGSRAPIDRSNEGFFKYSWDDTITRMTNIAAGQGRGINFGEWSAEAFPSPQVVGRVPGDSVYQYYGQSDIWYAGPAFNRVINGNEWAAMGYPTPTRINPPRPIDDKDCIDYARQRDAQADYDYFYPLYGDILNLDGNGDGIACNALP